MILLVRGGELYAPEARGRQDLLVIGERIAKVGGVAVEAVRALGLPVEELDASGCVVTPGFVDPHSHLIGTGGEQGYASRTGEIPYEELVTAGVTTVVGCLGTDDTTRNLSSLLGRVRQLQRMGLSAYMYTGSFHLPAPSLTGSVRSDLVVVPEVLGLGELAISDMRSTSPTTQELARLVSDVFVGGLLGEKAGVVHFHVGPGKKKLRLLRELLDEHDEFPPRQLYPTHVTRNRELLEEAIALAKRGAYVDTDTIEDEVPDWVRYYLEHGGPPDQLTLSSDAHTPGIVTNLLRERFLALVHEHRMPLERVLPFVTCNAAKALKLPLKGRVAAGADADLLVLEPDSLALRHVVSRGKFVLRDGVPVQPPKESFTEE